MNLVVGEMWSAWKDADLFLITTNHTVRNDGAAVMGRGAALEAKTRFVGLEYIFGKAILDFEKKHGHRNYGLMVSPLWPAKKLGFFQVKHNFNDNASPFLIDCSVGWLCQWCRAHPEAKVHLNFPGIGNGHLDRDIVLPIIKRLPSSVTIWEKA